MRLLELQAGFITAFRANAVLAGYCTGGIHATRIRTGLNYSYAFCEVKFLSRELSTGRTYSSLYDVKIRVYNKTYIGGAQLISESLRTQHDWKINSIAVNGARVMSIIPAPESFETDPDDHYGQDILLSKTGWIVKLLEEKPLLGVMQWL